MLKYIWPSLALSYGLSVFFWLVLGVFNLGGFIAVSALCGVAGGALGYAAGKKMWVALVATAIIRIVVYLIMT